MKQSPFRWLISVVFAILFFAMVNHALQHWVILPSFIRLEQEQAETELQRVIDAIKRETEHIELLAGDWATWDDTYHFVQDHNKEYINSNLVWKTLERSSGIHLLFFYDIQGRVVWGGVFDPVSRGQISVNEFPQAAVPSNDILLRHNSVDSAFTGIIDSSAGPILISSKPILTSQREGPIVGTLLMGRFLSDTLLEKLAAQTRVDFRAIPISRMTTNDAMYALFNHLQVGKSAIKEIDENSLQIVGLIAGLEGQPVLAVRAVIQRATMAQGLKVAGLASVSVLVSLALLGMILWLGINRYTLVMRASNARIKKVVQRRTQELKLAKEQAEESLLIAAAANESMSVFLANISHEVRTPMNAIINLSFLCLQNDIYAKQRDYIKKINYSAKSLFKVINDILDFSKVETGSMEIEIADFSLDELLAHLTVVIDSLKNNGKDIQLIFDVHPGTPTFLIGDVLRIIQILLNLLSNAIKFTESGQIVLSIRVLEYMEEKVTLEFSVDDSGIGMPQSVADKMIDPFVKSDTATTHSIGHSSLGLAICDQLCHLMGGNLMLTSKEGKGTHACVTLPLGVASRPLADTPNPASDKKVLLLGQDQKTLQAIDNTLTTFDVKVLRNVSLEITNDRVNSFDVLLIDESFPVVDVVNICKKHDLQNHGSLEIVFLTNGDQIPNALMSYPIRYLKKPIYFSSFCKTLSGTENDGIGKGSGNDSPETVHANSTLIAIKEETACSEQTVSGQNTEELAGLDIVSGLKNCSGKEALFENVLGKFSVKYKHIDDDIRRALGDEDIALARTLTHKLIGVSISIGALQLSDTARNIDNELADNPLSASAVPINLLSIHLQQVMESIEQYRGGN